MKHYAYNSPFNMVDDKGNKYKLTVEQDYLPFDPLDAEDMVQVYCWHHSYELGMKHDWEEPQDFVDYIHENIGSDNVCILPLILYDHSGLSISTTTDWPFNDRWDAMRVGWAFVTKQHMLSEGYSEDNWRKEGYKLIKDVIKDYDTYLRGDIWWYSLQKQVTIEIKCPHCNEIIETRTDFMGIDSCGGFLGSCLEENGILDDMQNSYGLTFEEE